MVPGGAGPGRGSGEGDGDGAPDSEGCTRALSGDSRLRIDPAMTAATATTKTTRNTSQPSAPRPLRAGGPCR